MLLYQVFNSIIVLHGHGSGESNKISTSPEWQICLNVQPVAILICLFILISSSSEGLTLFWKRSSSWLSWWMRDILRNYRPLSPEMQRKDTDAELISFRQSGCSVVTIETVSVRIWINTWIHVYPYTQKETGLEIHMQTHNVNKTFI